MNLRGKVVLVTGASRGIGAAIASAFAREGATVVINYLSNDAAAEQTVAACVAAGKDAGGDAWAIKADVGNAQAVQSMVDSIALDAGGIDIVVNNAFRPYAFDPERRSHFDELDWATISPSLTVLLVPLSMSAAQCCRRCAKKRVAALSIS